MNERIRELDKQAVDYALSVCDANGVYQGKEYLSVVKEKFAELLVRECGKVAFDDWCEGTNESSSEIAILKHFNVGIEK